LAPLLISLLLCWQNTMTGQKRSKTARLSGNKVVKHLVFKVVVMSSNKGQVVNSREVRQQGCLEVKQSSSQIVTLSGSKKFSCQIVRLSGSKKFSCQIVRLSGSKKFSCQIPRLSGSKTVKQSNRQPDCQETGWSSIFSFPGCHNV
jgi:hypothetical protein